MSTAIPASTFVGESRDERISEFLPAGGAEIRFDVDDSTLVGAMTSPFVLRTFEFGEPAGVGHRSVPLLCVRTVCLTTAPSASSW